MPPKKRNRKDAGLEKYEEEFRSLADEQLRRSLTDVGVNPGPIDSSNRLVEPAHKYNVHVLQLFIMHCNLWYLLILV